MVFLGCITMSLCLQRGGVEMMCHTGMILRRYFIGTSDSRADTAIRAVVLASSARWVGFLLWLINVHAIGLAEVSVKHEARDREGFGLECILTGGGEGL